MENQLNKPDNTRQFKDTFLASTQKVSFVTGDGFGCFETNFSCSYREKCSVNFSDFSYVAYLGQL